MVWFRTIIMFRTLQNSGGVITIFHHPKVSKLVDLLKTLTQADRKFNNDKQQFLLDKMEKTMPTYDQYATITHNCLKDTYSKNVLKNCFPFVSGTNETALGKDRVTVQSPINLGTLTSHGLKMFSESEYLMVYEAFAHAIESQEFLSTQVFLPPLVVDWDQNLIANDEHGVAAILQKYKSL